MARPPTAPVRRRFPPPRVRARSPVRVPPPQGAPPVAARSSARRWRCRTSPSRSLRPPAARRRGLRRRVSRAARPLVRRAASPLVPLRARGPVPLLVRAPGPAPRPVPGPRAAAVASSRPRVPAAAVARVQDRVPSPARVVRVPATTRSRPTPAAWASPGRRVLAATARAVAAPASVSVVTVRRATARCRVRRRVVAAARAGPAAPVRVLDRPPAARVPVLVPVVPVLVARGPTR